MARVTAWQAGRRVSALTRLRPPRPDEAELLQAWRAQRDSEYDDFAGPDPRLDAPHATPPPGAGSLLVTDGADTPLGDVGWIAVLHGPTQGSVALNIGISLRAAARGQGHGTRAQRMLAEYLFATFPVHRLEASTDVANVAEQRALERAGFSREGVLRGAQRRQGTWHDLVLFSRLRTDPPYDG